MSTALRVSEINVLFDIPDIFCVISDSSVRAEFARIAHIEPLLSCKGKAVRAVVAYAAELCLNIAPHIAEEVVMVGSVPACTVKESSVKLAEIAAAAVGNASVDK